MDDEALLAEQRAYYRARAPEYDTWWQRTGRYDRGDGMHAEWARQVETVENALTRFDARGDVLELAGGTGWWTERLARTAARLTVVDASAETLALNRDRVQRADVEYVVADLFGWEPSRQYDVVFFSFWLSHVPRARFSAFWDLVRRSLRPDGRVFLIDNRHDPQRTEGDPFVVEYAADLHRRELDDGREFHVVKVMYEPAELQDLIEREGWGADIHGTSWFLHGSASPRGRASEPEGEQPTTADLAPSSTLRRVDPERRRGPLYRGYARLTTTRPIFWVARNVGWKVDPPLLRLTRGRVGTGLFLPTAVLETRGTRTGAARRNALIYFHDGDDVIVAASHAGLPTHPGWFHNLVATPDVTFGNEPFRASVVEADLDRLWAAGDRVFLPTRPTGGRQPSAGGRSRSCDSPLVRRRAPAHVTVSPVSVAKERSGSRRGGACPLGEVGGGRCRRRSRRTGGRRRR